MSKKELTDKDLEYCELRAAGMTQDEAWVAIGYKSNRGNAARYENSKESIKPKIKELRAEKLAELGIDEYYIKQKFKLIADTAIEGDLSNANRALENLAKSIGFYEEDNKQKGIDTINVINYSRGNKDE